MNLKRWIKDSILCCRYFIPRSIRLVAFGGFAISCFVASVLSVSRLVSLSPLERQEAGDVGGLLINLIGLALFFVLFLREQNQGQLRVIERKKIRKAQIARGDREVYINAEGRRMSVLKEVMRKFPIYNTASIPFSNRPCTSPDMQSLTEVIADMFLKLLSPIRRISFFQCLKGQS